MKYSEYTDEQIQEIKRLRDRRKRQQITVIVFILGVLFALVGSLERGGAIYLVLGIACLLMGVIYLLVTLMGVWSRGALEAAPNGGTALAQIAQHYLGKAGLLVLAATVPLARL